jgi:hypothetical protein
VVTAWQVGTPIPPFHPESAPAEGPQEEDVGGGARYGARESTPRLRRESASTGLDPAAREEEAAREEAAPAAPCLDPG